MTCYSLRGIPMPLSYIYFTERWRHYKHTRRLGSVQVLILAWLSLASLDRSHHHLIPTLSTRSVGLTSGPLCGGFPMATVLSKPRSSK